MKSSKLILFSIFATAVFIFIVSCSGGSNKYDEYSDWDDDKLDDSDQMPEDIEPVEDTDTKEDEPDNDNSTPANDNDPSDNNDNGNEDTDQDKTDEEPEHDDDDPESKNDSEPDDTDTDTNDNGDNVPDETPIETHDEDSIPEKEEPATICTGQDKCFNNKKVMDNCPSSPDDDFFGQDAQYANKSYCQQKTFSTTSDTVTDNITGLTWQRNLPKEGCSNSDEKGNIICTKQEAINYCNNLKIADYDSGWRLPTPEEFATIKDFGSASAIADKFSLPDTPEDTSKIFWTATSSIASSGKSWSVYFATGETKDEQSDSKSYYVRCVRGEQLAKPDFKTLTENGKEEIVYDSTNNLEWTKIIVDEDNKEKDLSWKAALKECEDLEYAGETDWRLPNINELASLIDYSRSNPASAFPGLKSLTFWSSTSYVANPSKAWIVDISSGTVEESMGKSGGITANILCVR